MTSSMMYAREAPEANHELSSEPVTTNSETFPLSFEKIKCLNHVLFSIYYYFSVRVFPHITSTFFACLSIYIAAIPRFL